MAAISLKSNLFPLLYFLLISGHVSASNHHPHHHHSSASHRRNNVTAVFALGDSTLDSGNNNYIGTIFTSNHPPYGRDFPGRVATGRFTNGRLVTDFIVEHLGLKRFLPAFLDPNLKDGDLMTGVSLASAGSGIDEETASIAHVLSLEQQVNYFKVAIARIEGRVGAKEAKRIVNNALFVISSGTNDILDNFYWLPLSPRKLEFFTVSRYHDFLLQKLQRVFLDLHELGARKFLVAGMPPTGCLPLQMTGAEIFPIFGPHTFQRRCVVQQNADSQSYNAKLQGLIEILNSQKDGTKFVYADIYNPLMNMIENPYSEGFKVTAEGCCGVGLVETGPLCVALPCPDPSRYVFWDSIHPTEAAYSRITKDLIENTLPKVISN